VETAVVLSRIHHVGLAVKQANAALAFYRDLLGLPVTKDAIVEEQGVRGVLLSVGETEIELLEPLQVGSPIGRYLDRRGEGLHHLCFATDDIEQELASARERSLPLIDERPRPGLAGLIAFLHPKATCGVLVEYAQPPEAATPDSGSGDKGLVRGFDHVAVAVSEIEAGVAAFSGNFGLAVSGQHDVPALGIRAAAIPIGSAWIGVVTPLTPETPVGHFIAARGEGLYLISLGVSNLDPTLATLRQAGALVTEPVSPGSGSRLAFISPRSAYGVLVQLVEQSG
jgi:methylmalonyl-CoA/ethylmalonyl-CoA epimerase